MHLKSLNILNVAVFFVTQVFYFVPLNTGFGRMIFLNIHMQVICNGLAICQIIGQMFYWLDSKKLNEETPDNHEVKNLNSVASDQIELCNASLMD